MTSLMQNSNFEYKTLDHVFKEYKNQPNLVAQLEYAKQLKKDAYDYVYPELNLDQIIIRLQNRVFINHG